jgi:hypothetical protein
MSLGIIAPVMGCLGPPSADAGTYDGWYIPGCNDVNTNGATPKLQQWLPGAKPKVWNDPNHEFGQTQWTLYANTYYWFCPQGDLPNKVKVYAYKFCYQLLTTNLTFVGYHVNGFKYNFYYATNAGSVLNPGPGEYNTGGGTNKGDEGCSAKIGIPSSDQFWMFKSNNPFWEVGGSVDQQNAKDTAFNFDAWGDPNASGNKMYLKPDSDTSLLNP